MKPIVQRLGRIALIFVLSMVGSYTSALAFICVQTWSLPPSDLAYGQGVRRTLSDPFVMAVARFWATAAGLIVFLIAVWALRGRSALVSFGFCLAAAVAAIAMVTPFGGAVGILAGLAATGIALGWCVRSSRDHPRLELR